MKIEINTADILGDEATIRDEVVEQIASSFMIEMRKDAQTLIRDTLETALANTIQEKVSELVDMHLDTEFTETNQYGRVGDTITFRNKIADILKQQCVFKKTNYRSDQNAFTGAVINAVENEMKKFQKEYVSLVNKKLLQECLDDATTKLKAACGIK